MPELGRFFNIDPLAEKYYHNSMYAFSENKVVAHIELEGLESVSIEARTARDEKKYEVASFTVDLKANSLKANSGFIGLDTDGPIWDYSVNGVSSVDKPDVSGKGGNTAVEGSLESINGADYNITFNTTFNEFSDENGNSYGTIQVDSKMEGVKGPLAGLSAESGTIKVDSETVLKVDGDKTSSSKSSTTLRYGYNAKSDYTFIVSEEQYKKAQEQSLANQKKENDKQKQD